MAGEKMGSGQGARPKPGEGRGQAGQRGGRAGQRELRPGEPHPFAPAQEKGGQSEEEEFGPLLLERQALGGAPVH